MIRRVCSRLVRTALVMIMVLLLLLVVFIWRLVEEPIPLNLLTPYIETALPPSLTGLQVDVQDVVLAWHRQAKRIVLSARDIHLRDAQGIVDASLPAIDVTLNLRTLLRQHAVALNKVYIDGAQVHLQVGTHDTKRPALILPTPASILKALETFLAALESRPLFADLRAVHVVKSAVTLDSPSLPHPFHISELDLILDRTANHIHSQLSLTTALSDTDSTFKLETVYQHSDHQLTLKSQFINLRPSVLATLDPSLSSFAGISIPLAGSLNLTLNPRVTWPTADFNIQGNSGQVTVSGLYREPLQIKGLTAIGRLNGTSETLRIETATLDLGASKHGTLRLHLQSTMTGLSPPTRVESDVTLTDFTMADLERYWPPEAAQTPRQWITQNIPEGLIQKTKAHLVLGASKAHQKALAVHDLTGSFQYKGLELHYLRPLPPLQNIIGQGQFNRSGFHFQIANGNLKKMALTGGEVDITGLDRLKPTIAIRPGLTGPLREAFTLLNHPRLNLMADLGMPLETATGQFQIELQIAFALGKAVRGENVDINVQGMLQDVSLQDAALSHNLSNGQIYINLDKHRLTVEGQAEWATIPLSFTSHTILNKKKTDTWRHRMHVRVPRVGHAGRAQLGYDWPGMLAGPMGAVIDTQSGWDKQQTIDLQLDLRETTLNLPWLNWHKPAGEPAKAVGKIQLTASRVIALTDLHLETDTLKARGSAQFDGTTFERVDFPHVVFGTSDLRDVVFQPLNPGLAITIGDGFLDAAPFKQLLTHPSNPPATDATQPIATFPVQLHLPRLHRVQIAPGRYLHNVRTHLAWNGTGWNAITASGRVPAELTRRHNDRPEDSDKHTKTFDFRYLPTAAQPPHLSLQTNDIGAVLRALNIYDNLIGGDLSVTGRSNQDGTGIKTKVQAAQFTIQHAPVIAHVLAAASLHGLTNLLSNDGLKLDHLDAEITLYGDRLTIKRSEAHGGSLGITARGDVVYQTGGLDLQGTIIPAYLVNSILGQVPVVNLLVGGKGQGLVAVNYRLTGEIAKPHVSVNPISALTPGFLRGVFGLLKKDKEDETSPSSPEVEPAEDMPMTEP